MNIEAHTVGYRTAATEYWGFVWKVFATISVVVGVGSAFSNFEYLKGHPVRAGVIVASVTLCVSLLLLVDWLVKAGIREKAPLVVSAELVKIVTALYAEAKYLDVVRFGSPFSRYLWLNGYNHERIAIGKLVEDAASKVGRTSVQVSCLIDDIGWTYDAVGDAQRAVRNIASGVEKAVEHELFYLAAKGERHLSGIYKHQGDVAGFRAHLDKAQAYCAQITDTSDRAEIAASLGFAEAKFLFEAEKWSEAEALAKKALVEFGNDPDRVVKIHALLGNIYWRQGKVQKAKDEFNRGYNSSQSIRKDEVARNARGLAEIALAENDIKTGLKYLSEAREIYLSLDKKAEAHEVEKQLRAIRI